MFEYLFFGILIVIAVGGIWAWLRTKKTKRDGIETTAEISRVETIESMDGDGMISRSKNYYVSFRQMDGSQIESLLSNPKKGMEQGQQIKIRYLPESPEYPVFIEYI